MVCVFGNNGNEAIVVDHDDDVYAIGSNSCCCLGFGYQTSTLQPRKVLLTIAAPCTKLSPTSPRFTKKVVHEESVVIFLVELNF